MRLLQAIDRAAERLRSALIDPKRADRAVLVSLAVYVVVWAAYGTMSKWPQGLHPDMTELVAWSRDVSLGYLKHPPLAAWLVAAWFAVFPTATWSYYLLAMLMPALGLWIAWRLSADYLPQEKRIVGMALLMLVPFFNFHALKFNVNTVLVPLWAATALCFLRSYRTRSVLWAALAGLAAAGAMLGKYWSVFLLAGLMIAALIDRRRMDYFRSPAPWVTVAIGALALAPHVIWLVQHDFAPFTYAMIVHGEKPLTTTLVSVLGYLGGSFGYIAVPFIVAAVLAKAKPAVLADMMWPREDNRGLVAMALWLPFLLPMLGAILGRSEITSLWSMPCWTLLTILLLSPDGVTVRAVDTRRLLLAAIGLPLTMLMASPVIAVIAQGNNPLPASAHAELLARQVEEAWRQVTPQSLRFVGGEADLAYAVSTFGTDRPRALTDMPAPPADELRRAGSAWVCFADRGGCKAKVSPQSRTIESGIVRGFWGRLGKPQRYTIVIVPPSR